VLAKAMHRPALFPAPAFALRLALGEMADALLLSSQRVAPGALEKVGYQFLHADLPLALAAILAKS
jgi:NAD dependent epimerase/dehydratase family enzyme